MGDRVRKEYEAKKENKLLYYIQHRQRKKNGQWGSWINKTSFEEEKDRDVEFKRLIGTQTQFFEYRKFEKYQKGIMLTPEQKLNKTGGEGEYHILCKEFDKDTKKLSGNKIYKRFKTATERTEYLALMTEEEREGKIFSVNYVN